MQNPKFAARLAGLGMALNGFAMGYYGESQFKLGAFINPDPAIRRKAIDLGKRGIDAPPPGLPLRRRNSLMARGIGAHGGIEPFGYFM